MRAFRLLSLLLLTAFACWLAFEVNGRPVRGVDDAQILFSYSSNLVAGKGLVYANNPEHVEGATSLLWTLVCAVPFVLGLHEGGVLVISVLILWLTQLLVLDIIRRSAADRRTSSWPFELLYLLAVFSSPAYVTWMSITLMDTCLWGFLVVLMTYVSAFPPRTWLGAIVAAVPFFLAPLSRPEAVVAVPAIIVFAWFRSYDSAGRRRLVSSLTVAFLVSTVAVTAFRLIYFGYPLPNTFYAKVSPSLTYNVSEGMVYLAGFLLTSGPAIAASGLFLLWCAVSSAGLLVGHLRRGIVRLSSVRIATWRLAALCSVVLLAVPVLTGGDHFALYRFYQPALPIVILAGVLLLMDRLPTYLLESLAPAGLLRSRFAAAIVLTGLLYWAYTDAHHPSWSEAAAGRAQVLDDQFVVPRYGIQMGRRLETLFSRLPTYPAIGVIAAGAIARAYRGRIVDLMGLNTLEIAHRHGSRDGFKNHAAFERDAFFEFPEIDVLDAAPATPTRKSFARFALKGLLQDPRFVADWRYGRLRLSNDGSSECEAFYRAGLIDRLTRTGQYEFSETVRWSGERWVDAGGAGTDTAAEVQ